MRIVIVEDHPDICRELVEIVRARCDGAVIAGSASTVVDAAKLIRETHPDLILLDVSLPDGSGFDLLDILDDAPPVIFITGSDAHAIRAFRYAALDYLIKPVDPDELCASIHRVSGRAGPDRRSVDLLRETLAHEQGLPGRIALHTADKIRFFDLSDILRCAADGNYTMFYIKGGAQVLVSKTLKDYDQLLSGAGFIRVHQSHLVNIRHIREYVKTDGGYLVIQDGTKIPVSTRKRPEVLAVIDRFLHT